MSDQLRRFIFDNTNVRGQWVNLEATWRAVLERHDYPPVLQQVLGELMAAASLLSSTLKFTGALILQIQGSGPVRLIVVECTSDQTLRATAKWEGELEGGLRTLVGDGRFVITIAQADAKQTYQGIVELRGDTVAEVLQHYMSTSEQLETRLWLASAPTRCAGLLLQRLPHSGQETQDDPDAWERAVTIAKTVQPDELLRLPCERLLHRLYHQERVRLFDSSVMSFRCSCTRDRVANMLRMLGPDEVHGILTEREEIEVHCEFCNRRYAFDRVDAEQLFAAQHITGAGSTRH